MFHNTLAQENGVFCLKKIDMINLNVTTLKRQVVNFTFQYVLKPIALVPYTKSVPTWDEPTSTYSHLLLKSKQYWNLILMLRLGRIRIKLLSFRFVHHACSFHVKRKVNKIINKKSTPKENNYSYNTVAWDGAAAPWCSVSGCAVLWRLNMYITS